MAIIDWTDLEKNGIWQWIFLTDTVFKKLSEERIPNIDIRIIIEGEEVDPLLFDKITNEAFDRVLNDRVSQSVRGMFQGVEDLARDLREVADHVDEFARINCGEQQRMVSNDND